MRVAFDIDDTLIVPSVATGLDRDTPNYENIAILKWFQAQGHEIILWSGSGIDWATTWGNKLGLSPFSVLPKQKLLNSHVLGNQPEGTRGDEAYVDIAFDDCYVDLAKVNVKVKRINNSISRAEWNKTKTPPHSLE